MTGLFDAEEYRRPLPPKPEKLSAGRRLTIRQQQDIARGWHPLSHTTRDGLKLAPAGTGTCGTCRFRSPSSGDGTWPKCKFGAYEETRTGFEGRTYTLTHYPRASSSAATDCRAKWPACTDYQKENPS